MRIQYTLTPDDFSEATRRRMLTPRLFVVIGGLVVSVILLPQILWPQVPLASPPPTPPSSLMNDVILPFVPWLVILLVIWVSVFRMLRGGGAKPWRKRYVRGGAPSRLMFWITAAVMAGVVGVLIGCAISAKRQAARALGAAADPTWSPAVDTVLPLIPLMLILTLGAFFIARIFSPNRLWMRQYHLHRPSTAEIDQDKLRISEPLSSHEYGWDYFPGFVETPNLFVLYPSPLLLVMIPKRAFESVQAWQSFGELLHHRINERNQAFPVMAIPLPPVPAHSD